VAYELVAGDCLQCKETVDNASITRHQRQEFHVSSIDMSPSRSDCNRIDNNICQDEQRVLVCHSKI